MHPPSQIAVEPAGAASPPATILRFEGRCLDLEGRALFDANGREVPLTHAEFELLALLARCSGRALSRDQLRNGVSGRGHEPFDRSIDMLVARLRRKIEPSTRSPRFILTIPGVGYKFAVRVETAGLTAPTPPQLNQASTIGTAARTGERRQLSVLACRVRGLAALSARLDPEDEAELVRSVHLACAGVAERLGGGVASILGESVLVYFGYREAQEDDPERAVRAGLKLIGAIHGLDPPGGLRAHVGIATGMMMVGTSPGTSPGTFPGPPDALAAAGQAINLALRLQSAAPPDSVLITGRTRELVGGFFDCQEMEPLVPADDLAPVAVWRVTGESENAGRFEALRKAGTVQLVGRTQELDLLRRRWSQAVAGVGHVAMIAGEPGIGKSRLVAEFLETETIGARDSLRYFGSPRQTDAAFSAVIGELQRAARLDRTDTPGGRLAKLGALLGPAGGAEPQDAALIADLLSPPAEAARTIEHLTPQQRKERTLAGLLARIKRLAARRPLLVLVEDAHWLDPTSLELFSLLVEALPRLPVMLLITARPEFAPPWPVYAHMTCVTLARLGREDAESLIGRVVGGKTLPGEVLSEILAQADGVPLFIEEMTKALLESGALRERPDRYDMIGPCPSRVVPKTLNGLLQARLDRLGPAKEIAQVGAVIGREFSHELLNAVCGWPEGQLRGALQELVASGLVFRRGAGTGAVYSFKHALVQDAAYGSLLRGPKRTLHARIAEALECRFSDLAESRPEALAHHCTEAGLVEKAADLWGKAGEQSLARSALLEATVQLDRALAQIAALPGTAERRRRQIRLQVALANALMHTKGYASPATRAAFHQARAYIEQAEALGDAAEDPLLLFAVIYGFWVGSYVAFEGDALRDLAADFLSHAEKQRATVPLMVGHRLMGTSLQCMGDIAASRTHYDRALALYDPAAHRALATHFGQDVGVVVLSYRAWTLWLLGYPEAARADADRAVGQARDIGQAATLMYALAHAARTCLWTGDHGRAGALIEEILALAEEKGASAWRAFATMHKGSLLALAGAALDGARMIATGLGAWQSTGSTLWMPCYLSSLARAYAEIGRADDAARRIGEAMAAVEMSKATWCEAEVHRIAGEIALMRPDPDRAKAQACFESALASARAQRARSWELRAAVSLARLWRDQGRRRKARDLLAPVFGWFTEGLDTRDLREANALLDGLGP